MVCMSNLSFLFGLPHIFLFVHVIGFSKTCTLHGGTSGWVCVCVTDGTFLATGKKGSEVDTRPGCISFCIDGNLLPWLKRLKRFHMIKDTASLFQEATCPPVSSARPSSHLSQNLNLQRNTEVNHPENEGPEQVLQGNLIMYSRLVIHSFVQIL